MFRRWRTGCGRPPKIRTSSLAICGGRRRPEGNYAEEYEAEYGGGEGDNRKAKVLSIRVVRSRRTRVSIAAGGVADRKTLLGVPCSTFLDDPLWQM